MYTDTINIKIKIDGVGLIDDEIKSEIIIHLNGLIQMLETYDIQTARVGDHESMLEYEHVKE